LNRINECDLERLNWNERRRRGIDVQKSTVLDEEPLHQISLEAIPSVSRRNTKRNYV
jgi:hypothetical protein